MKIVTPGKTIVGFTKDQVKAHNIVMLKGSGIQIEVSDYFNPNEYSIEEAVVLHTHPNQTFFKEGDNVLIDFSVFTKGKHGQFEGSDETRFVEKDEQWDKYWLVDPLHKTDMSEVFAVISDDGKVVPIGDAIFIHPPKNDEAYKKSSNNLYLSELRKRFEPIQALVHAAPPGSEVKEGDTILCEAGFNVKIKYRGIEMEYVNFPFIIGKMVDDQLVLF
jgi:hypothetical protein